MVHPSHHPEPLARPEPAPDTSPTALPAHIEETIQSIARLHTEYHQSASPSQRAIDHLTKRLGRPHFVVLITLGLLGWVGSNTLATVLGYHPVDPPPFHWMIAALSLGSFFTVVLILSTQQREEEFAQHRGQLALQLTILGEQKTAKVIQLLEELRRDSPSVRDRVDQEADAMAQRSATSRPPARHR
jgi:uncharacterized membrane protein